MGNTVRSSAPAASCDSSAGLDDSNGDPSDCYLMEANGPRLTLSRPAKGTLDDELPVTSRSCVRTASRRVDQARQAETTATRRQSASSADPRGWT